MGSSHAAKEPLDALLPGVVGDSPAMRAVYRLTRLVATSRASVLLVGETGTGKEVIARNIDRKSTRLNSSHVSISYAVFCLKKKKMITERWIQLHHFTKYTGSN